MPRHQTEGTWEYPPLAYVMRLAGLKKIGKYISRRKDSVEQYIATYPIMDLFLDTESRTGSWKPVRWWDQ